MKVRIIWRASNPNAEQTLNPEFRYFVEREDPEFPGNWVSLMGWYRQEDAEKYVENYATYIHEIKDHTQVIKEYDI